MIQKDTDQLRHVLTFIIENGDTWATIPEETQTAAMAQFIRLENESLAHAEADPANEDKSCTEISNPLARLRVTQGPNG